MVIRIIRMWVIEEFLVAVREVARNYVIRRRSVVGAFLTNHDNSMEWMNGGSKFRARSSFVKRRRIDKRLYISFLQNVTDFGNFVTISYQEYLLMWLWADQISELNLVAEDLHHDISDVAEKATTFLTYFQNSHRGRKNVKF